MHDRLRDARRVDALDVGEDGRHGTRLVGLRDDHDRRAGAAGEVRGEHLLAHDGRLLAAERLLRGQAGRVQRDDAEARHGQDRGRPDPRGTRAALDPTADAGPEAVLGRLVVAELRRARPEDPPAARHQQGGEQGQHDEDRDADADGRDRAEARGRVHAREQQAQHADGHGGAGRDDRRAGAVQGQGHRLVPVAVLAQLLAVARHQQQGVVRPRAEHEDGEDAGALGVDREVVVVREQVDQGLRHGERDARRDDRQEPEDRAAVRDEQDDDDDGDGRVEQGAVDALERRGRVRGAAGRSGHVDVQPVGAVLRGGAQVVDRVGREVPAVRAEVERDDDLDGLAVLRRDRADHLTVERVQRAELLGVRPRPRPGRRSVRPDVRS